MLKKARGDNKNLKAKGKVIVTGGAGFIGSHLVSQLVSLGYTVIVVDNLTTGSLRNLKEVLPNIILLKVDISNFKSLYSFLKKISGVEIIYHLAALPRIERATENPLDTHLSNVDGVLNVLEVARRLKVKKVIFTSSSSVYGIQKKNPLKETMVPNPQNLYATQKLIGEKYCEMFSRVFGMKITVLRLFNIYGRRMKGQGAYQLVFTKWLAQKKKKLPLVIYGDGNQTRDFTYISDAVDGLIRAMKMGQMNDYELINIGSGRQVSINYLSQLFAKRVKHIHPRKFEERFKQANVNKAKRLLSWEPKVTIEDGVKELLST